MGWFNWNKRAKYLCVWCDDKFDSKDTRDSHALDCEKAPRQQSNRELGNSLETYLMIEKAEKDEEARNLMIEKAEKHEKLLEFEAAAEIYKEYGMDDEIIRVREKARNKVEQTVVHGDQITKTKIKDSFQDARTEGPYGDEGERPYRRHRVQADEEGDPGEITALRRCYRVIYSIIFYS